MAAFRGAGRLLVSVIESDSSESGYYDIDNLAELSIGIEGGTTTTLKATTDGTGGSSSYGATIGSATETGDDTGTVRFNEPNRKNLELAFLGTDSDYSVTGAAVTGESVTFKEVGAWVPLAHQKLNASVSPPFTLASTASPPVPYTENTDYEVDYVNGLIRSLSGGAISANGTATAGYTHQTRSGYAIAARTRSTINAKIIFVGTNLETDERVRITANRVEITPNQAGQFISVDNAFLEFGLGLVFKVPTGESNPYNLTVYS